MIRVFFLCALVAISIGDLSAAAVQVVTREIEPFSFERDGRRTGFAINLWESVAREINLESSFVTVDTAKQMVESLAANEAEVAVGALSITSEREQVIDFSQPFYQTGLQILVSKQASSIGDTVFSVLSNVFTWQLLVGVAAAVSIMFVISHLVWMYEHRVNEEMWPRTYLKGMGESLWWTLSIFLVGGADNKGPVGTGGRIVATLWMLVSVIAVSVLTASLSAVFTVNSLTGDISGPGDLPGKTVATIAGSTTESFLQKLGSQGGERVSIKTFPDIPACLDALKHGAVKAVVFDASILRYHVNKLGPDDFTLVGSLFDRSNYGFGLREGSMLREPINRALLKLNENGVTDDLKRKWFGSEE